MSRKIIVSLLGTIALSACSPVGSSSGLDSSNNDQSSNPSTPTAPTTPSTPVPPVPQAPPPVVARPSNAANLTICPGNDTELGLDVSDYDPNTNWTKVAASNRGFAFVKATEGSSYINPSFAADWANAKAAGVVRGAYHFFHADADPTAQANTFLKTIGKLGLNDMPPVFDWEVTDNQSNATQIARAKTFLQLVEAATGRIPIVYTSASFFNPLGNPQGFERYPLFVAEYKVACPKIPPPWSKWTFWQYADTGNGGISGVTNSDIDQDFFVGTLAQLAQFVLTGSF
jgi:lysozyme